MQDKQVVRLQKMCSLLIGFKRHLSKIYNSHLTPLTLLVMLVLFSMNISISLIKFLLFLDLVLHRPPAAQFLQTKDLHALYTLLVVLVRELRSIRSYIDFQTSSTVVASIVHSNLFALCCSKIAVKTSNLSTDS